MKDIPGFEGRYAATEDGKIWSYPKKSKKYQEGFIEGWVRNGYRMLTIDEKAIRWHRLIAQTFLPNPLELPFVNHLNGKKLDNRIQNLEWCTAQRNVQHAFDTGLMSKGSKSVHSLLTEQEVLEIKILLKSNRLTFEKIAQLYGISVGAIEKIFTGRSWKDVEIPIAGL